MEWRSLAVNVLDQSPVSDEYLLLALFIIQNKFLNKV